MPIKRLLILFALVLAYPAYAQFSKSTISSQITSQFPDQNLGQITPATTRAFLNNLLASYQQYAGLNKQVGTSYTIQASDYGQLVTFNNGGTVNVTLTPANATGFSTFNFYIENITTGNVVVTPSGSTICGASALTLANTQAAWVISDGTNWQCVFSIGANQLSNPVSVSQGGTGGSSASGTLLDNITGFGSTGFLLRSGAGSYAFQSATNGILLSNITQLNANTTLCNATGSVANATACNGGTLAANLCNPVITALTNGNNATFTTPTCNSVVAKYIELTIVGGGGGGAGAGGAPGTATQGNSTCWNSSSPACTTPLLSANGGGAGSTSPATAAVGGTVTGSLLCDMSWTGGSGGGGSNQTNTTGGSGGASTLGGQGVSNGANSAAIQPGLSAIANSGSGGSGAADSGVANSGGGGAAGGTCWKMIAPAALTYSYTIGTGGTGGTNGGNGAAGIIYVRSKWQ